MNDLPRQKLCELIATYGRSLCDDPRRCEALLKDLCGQYRREVHVLIGVLKEGVAADLLASQRVPHEVLLARLTKRLHDNLALAEDAAKWAVESWALALGVIASAEGQTSQPKPESPTGRITAGTRPEKELTDLGRSSSPFPPPSVPPQYPQESLSQQSVPKPPLGKVNPQSQDNDATRLNKAKNQIRTAYSAGIFLCLLFATYAFNHDWWKVIDVVLVFVLTIGINEKSRVCAVLMFIYFVWARIVWFTVPGAPPTAFGIAFSIIFCCAFFQGILGTFTYHLVKARKTS